MLTPIPGRSRLRLALLVSMFLFAPSAARAHCDSMDGPVVRAAQRALASGNVGLVLIWVRREDEPEIRDAFERTLRARRHAPDVQELADRWFFETLVRVHRAGEGAPYTGLKPAGSDFGPAVAAADDAVGSGSAEELERILVHAVRDGLRERFQELKQLQGYDENDVEAGRAWVAAYVSFIHYAEAIHEAAASAAQGHFPETAGAAHEGHASSTH